MLCKIVNRPAPIALVAALMTSGLAHGAEPAKADPPKAAPYHVPRTAYGAPDLQGMWTNTSLTFLVRPPVFKGLIATDAEEKMMIAGFMQLVGDLLSTDRIDPNKPAPPVVKAAPNVDYLEIDPLELAKIDGKKRSSWITEPENGQIPFTDAGKAAYTAAGKSSFDGPEKRPMTERCLVAIGSPESPPMMNTGFNANYQFLQTRDTIAILVEMNHDTRIIRMNDRSHPAPAVRLWMGDSVGWWEGETLVVETTNFNTGGMVDSLAGGFVYGLNTKVTERFTRTGKDSMLYQFTIEDPDYFKQAWKGEMPMRTAKGPIYEYACHEGNYAVGNALAGARYQEAEKAAATAKTAQSDK